MWESGAVVCLCEGLGHTESMRSWCGGVRTDAIERVTRCGILGTVHAGTEGASAAAAGASRAAGMGLQTQVPVCER
jgi:hypothetical protein